MPALSSAKEKSRRAGCKNDVRQVTFAAITYAGDHREYFPSGKRNNGAYQG